MEDERVTIEDVNKFYKFLQGEVPKDINMKRPIRLSSKQAFDVIWYLQEVMKVLPDHYERCKTCGRLFDSDSEGNTKTMHCDNCRKD